jgi:PAS domain S-box-containing protein
MNKIDNFGKVIQDMSLLYELALATGQSLDLKESCDLFLKRLMGRKNLSYSAVWIKDNFLTGEEYQQAATLIYAFPEFFPKSKKLPLDHPLFTCLNKEKIVKVSSNKKEFWQLVDEKGITKGTYIVVSLDEIGAVKLFSMTTGSCFSDIELNQIRKVISKFAVSLKGCLSHKKLLTEIAERKRAEEALRQSDQQMADIINFLPDATFAINLEGKVIFWNRAIEVMTGVKAEDIIGKGNFEYAVPFYNDRRPIIIDLVFKAEEKLNGESYLFLKRLEENSLIGETFCPALGEAGAYLWAKATPLYDINGNIIGAIESLRDITDRKQAEKELQKVRIELEKRVEERTAELAEAVKALRFEIADRKRAEAALAEEKELLSVTLHSIGDGVITTDTLGKVSSINRVAEEITGWRQMEVEGKPLASIFQILINEKMSKTCENPLEKVLKSEKEGGITGHNVLIARDGTRKIISANAAPIRDKKHNIVGYVIIFRDITKQKKVEAQLALSQKLQSIGQLAAGIAHEINTPMQYIGDNVRFLQDAFKDIYTLQQDYKQLMNELENVKVFGPLINEITKKEKELDVTYLIEEIPRAIEQTLEGVERVTKLVLAMKDFAHPGKKEKKLADINKAIERTVTISRNEWKYVAELETNLEPGLPLIYCVVDEINQVILNMIVNAAQAIKEAVNKGSLAKGKITVTTKKDKNFVDILIRDNGTGIPRAMIDKIFDPFFTTKEVGKGTGQGLAIAHDIIVTKHKGNIQVESEMGKGTMFTIRLPINSYK